MSVLTSVKFLAVVVLIHVGTKGPALAQNSVVALETIQLLESGEQLLAAGQFAAAENSFYEAFQTSRANYGFYNAEQIPILEYIMATSLKRGNWEDFLRRAAYLEQLSMQLYAHNPDLRLASLEALSGWHLAAAAAMDQERSVWHFIKSRNLLWLAVSQIEGQAGRNDPRLSPLLYQIALNHYYMARSTQRRRITSYELRTDTPAFISGWSLRGTEALRKNYEIGLELLHRIRNIAATNSQSDKEIDGMALLYIADWNLLFGRGADALAGYYQAYDQLHAAKITDDELSSFFSLLSVLPAKTLDLAFPETPLTSGPGAAVFRHWSQVLPGVEAPQKHPFTMLNEAGSGIAAASAEKQVTTHFALQIAGAVSVARGQRIGDFNYQATDIAAQDNTRLSATDLASALAELAQIQFRPILLAGEAVNVQDVTVQYVFAD